ncbi:MAG TPA: serine hydrolase [Allosphingosinicella sp.]|nr:serine hydrolase [Allosphingosinicella sp.]
MNEGIKLALALLIGAVPAAAQQPPREPTTYDRAIAAGYKALTLCSGIFNARRTQAQVEALELTGIYPEFDKIVPALPATVESKINRVTVKFDEALPPRVAVSRGHAGCFLYPIGSPLDPLLQTLPPVLFAEFHSNPNWPYGDSGAIARPRGNARALSRGVDAAFAAGFGEGTRTTGIVVVQGRKIVAERYAEGFGIHTSQRTWSVAKSLAGTLIGVAVQKGLIDPAAPAPVPQWQSEGDPRATITLDQLMRMASGLHSATAGNRTDSVYFGGTAVTEETVAWPLEVPPGTRFRYANNDILLAVHALASKLGNYQDKSVPNAFFHWQVYMRNTVAETDWKGNYILSSQVWSTARDLARFGMLYLDNGMWGSERILPETWRDYVTRPAGPQPEGEFGYGATFWLMNKSPGVPTDTFAAFGNRGQYVVIVPSRKIVIVRRGEDPAGARFDVAKFSAEILAALRP